MKEMLEVESRVGQGLKFHVTLNDSHAPLRCPCIPLSTRVESFGLMVRPVKGVMDKEFAPIKKIKASEQVADMLRRHILGGNVIPGEKLPSERTLATRFNVTRTTLREALKTLEQLRLIVINQGQGITVKDFRDASIDLLSYLLKEGDDINWKILENIMEARILLGTEVARLAAKRAEADDIEQLNELMKKFVKTQDPEEYLRYDFEFFHQLAIASKNMVYILLLNTIKSLYEKNLTVFFPFASEMDTSKQEAIVNAIRNKDTQQAAAMAGEYLVLGIELWQRAEKG